MQISAECVFESKVELWKMQLHNIAGLKVLNTS